MAPDRLLVSDIDGTLLRDGGPTAGLDLMQRLIAAHRGAIALVYATGRSARSTVELVRDGVLPRPDAIASLIGTEIWLPPFLEPEARFPREFERGWDRARVLDVTAHIPGLELQPAEFQSRFKLSYYVGRGFKVYALEKLLVRAGVSARVVYSCGRYLDVLPLRAGKLRAVEFIRGRWGVPRSLVLTCGDSGNDADMLAAPGFRSIVVGNAQPELAAVKRLPHVHAARREFAAGLLEGATRVGFWPRKVRPDPEAA